MEKKLTNEEIVKALEGVNEILQKVNEDDCDERLMLVKDIVHRSLGVIRHLQDENKRLTEEKQSVKDTAKEIFTQVIEWLPVGVDYHWFITTLENWLKERYGEEVANERI